MRTRKSIKFLFLCMLFLSASVTLFAQKNEKDAKTVKLQTSAHTDACKAKIEKTLAYEKGILNSSLDQETQILTVKYNAAKTDVKKIIKVIVDLGHDAKEIPDEKNEEIKKEELNK